MMIFPNIDMEATGKNIRRLRMQHGYTVRDLQKYLSLGTPQAVYKWQQGITLPSIDNLVVLSWLFGVAIEEIIVCTKPAVLPSAA